MAAIDGIDLEYFLSASHLAIARGQSDEEEWAHFSDVLFRVRPDGFRLQPGIAIYMIRRILIGLQVMHEAGFLHGDVKPSNVMVDRLGSVKLVDFGRAAAIGEPVSIQLGSPLYMAPEIHRLEAGQVQSDLYSVGLVCLELLCGHFPPSVAGLSEAQLLEYKLTALPSRLEGMLPDYVRENKLLVGILRRLLDPDPSRRFSSAKETEESDFGLRGVHRQLSTIHLDAEYDREMEKYLEKLTDPMTGYINPRLE